MSIKSFGIGAIALGIGFVAGGMVGASGPILDNETRAFAVTHEDTCTQGPQAIPDDASDGDKMALAFYCIGYQSGAAQAYHVAGL